MDIFEEINLKGFVEENIDPTLDLFVEIAIIDLATKLAGMPAAAQFLAKLTLLPMFSLLHGSVMLKKPELGGENASVISGARIACE